MALTADHLAKLEAAYASGVLSVRDPSGRLLTYQNADALARAIDRAKRDIAAAAGTSRKRTWRITQTGKGY